MSQREIRFDPDELPPPICNFCGGEIEELDQDCPDPATEVCSP